MPAKFRKIEAILAFAWVICACSFSAADQQHPDLQSLYAGHHRFAFRDAVENGEASRFYRGAVEAAFHQAQRAKSNLEAVIRQAPHGDDAYEAHSLLAGLYLRTGQYREALSQTDALLAAKPGAADAKNVRGLFRMLSETPDQTILQAEPSTVRMLNDEGSLFLPVAVNEVPAQYAFDTDAAVSLLSESEAKRVGLAVRDVDTKIQGMSGAGVEASVAVAPRLVLGGVALANVAFYVLPDKQPPFDGLPAGRRGILGIPVIVALRTMRWDPRDNTFACGFPAGGADVRESNIAFDGASPLTLVKVQNEPLEFSLDTGAQKTDLYPSFAKKFARLLSAAGKKESRQLTGVDGSASFASVVLPSVTLEAGAYDVVLKPAHVLLVQNNGGSAWYFGNLGMDLLNQANIVTLDFQSMTLRLE